MKKYLMGFDLKEIYRINHLRNIKLSLKHLVILKWFVDFLGTNRMETKMIDNNVWYWCSYQKILSDLPILEITNKQVISRLIKELVEANIIESYIDRKIGNKTYLRLGKEYPNLIASDEDNKNNDFDHENYRHKKNTSRLKSIKGIDSKVDRVSTKKSIPLLTKKLNNRLVNTIDKLNIDSLKDNNKNTTTIDKLNYIEPTPNQVKKVSSSFSNEKIKEIKTFLANSIKDIATCKNIMALVNSKNIDLARLQEVINYALKVNKGNGYIIEALKNDWNIPSTSKASTTGKAKINTKAIEQHKIMTEEHNSALSENDQLDKFMATLTREEQLYINQTGYKLALEKCGSPKIAEIMFRNSIKYDILKNYIKASKAS